MSKASDENSFMYMKNDVTLLSISEVDVLFKSEHEIEVGRILKVTNPVEMQIVVVNHIPDSAEESIPNAYRGIIHYIKEGDLNSLRRYVNSVSVLAEDRKGKLSESDILALKAEYFD